MIVMIFVITESQLLIEIVHSYRQGLLIEVKMIFKCCINVNTGCPQMISMVVQKNIKNISQQGI